MTSSVRLGPEFEIRSARELTVKVTCRTVELLDAIVIGLRHHPILLFNKNVHFAPISFIRSMISSKNK